MRGIYVTACHTKSEFKKKKQRDILKHFFCNFSLINIILHIFKKSVLKPAEQHIEKNESH